MAISVFWRSRSWSSREIISVRKPLLFHFLFLSLFLFRKNIISLIDARLLDWLTDGFSFFFPSNSLVGSITRRPPRHSPLSSRISVDTRLHTLLDLRFNKPFFQRGDFPNVVFNGSTLAPLKNPWENGTFATPFDQGGAFYQFSFSVRWLDSMYRILPHHERRSRRNERLVRWRTR